MNLSVHSCIFPGSEIPVSDEIVPFPEKADVLELLLQHIYPDTSPNMDNIGLSTLSLLAEAAEKYHIFNVMEICRLHMKCGPYTPVSTACSNPVLQGIYSDKTL